MELFFVLSGAADLGGAESGVNFPAAFGEFGEFRGFEGKSGVDAAGGSGIREVLFYEAGAESDGGDGDVVAEAVVGESGGSEEFRLEGAERVEVEVARIGGVGADAFEEDDFGAAVGVERGEGFGDFAFGGHAGGEDDRAAGLGDFFEEGKVGEFEG